MRARSSRGSRSCARCGTPSGGRPPRRSTCTSPGCAASWAMTRITRGTSRPCAASASGSSAATNHGDPQTEWTEEAIVRPRLWLSAAAVAVAAVIVAAVPLLVVAAIRDPALLGLGLPLLAVAVAAAIVLAGIVAQRAARPVEELAEAAGRLGTGDPRPVGRPYGGAERDPGGAGLDRLSRRVTHLLTADRELAIDASHQLRTPLTALSMRLEGMIASAGDPDVG